MLPSFQAFQITAAGGSFAVDLSLNVSEFYFYSAGTLTLVGSTVIAPSGTPVDGEFIVVRCSARQLLNGNTFTIFGQDIDQELSMLNIKAECRWDAVAAAWEVIVMEDTSSIPFGSAGVTTTDLTAGGGTINLVAGVDDKHQRFTSAGVVTLLAGWVIQPSGITTESSDFWIYYDATMQYGGGNTLTLGSVTLSALEALSGSLMAHFIYDGSAWITQVWRRIPNTDDYRVMADAADTAPDYLSGKVSFSITEDPATHKLKFAGTDSVPGTYQFWGTGSTGGTADLAYRTLPSGTLLQTTITLLHTDILALFATPIQVIANPGVGLAVVVERMITNCKGGGAFVPYATNTQMNIFTDTSTPVTGVQIKDQATLVSTTERMLCEGALSFAPAGTTDIAYVGNKSVFIQADTGNPTGGAAGQTIDCTFFYRIISI